MVKIKKILKIAAIALLLIITVPLIIGQILRLMANVEPPAGKLVDVGGYKLHINCIEPEGTSDEDLPTVVIEAGAGTTSPNYHWIQKGAAGKTKVCVYDRAGLGWSEESNLPRDAKTISTALNTLLDKEGIKRPFVFAGHSIAGLYMRDYVERFPDDVAGLVFLDASHPEQFERMGLSQAQRDEMTESAKSQVSIVEWLVSLGVTEVYNPLVQTSPDYAAAPADIQGQLDYLSKRPSYLEAALAELDGFDAAAKQAGMNKTLGDRPIVVISATEEMPDGILPEGVSKEKFQAAFVNLHEEIVALSSKGKHIKIDSAGHMSLITNKENAANAVSYIIEVVKESAEKTESSDSDKESAETKEENK